MVTDLDYEKKYLRIVRETILDLTSGKSCSIFLYGSRAEGKMNRTADYDIAVSGLSADDFNRLSAEIKDWWEESIVPHKIDLINWDTTEIPFKEIAEKHRIPWTKN